MQYTWLFIPNSYLRAIFYYTTVVFYNLLRKDSSLKTYAKRWLEKKRFGPLILACCIVAAKIARSTFVLRDGVSFDPNYENAFRNAQRIARISYYY